MQLTGITPVLNVTNVPASIAWFEGLGWTRDFTWNQAGMIAAAADRNKNGEARFAGVRCGDFAIFLCHDGQGSRGTPPDEDYMRMVTSLPAGVSPDEDTGGVWMSWWLKTPSEVDEVCNLARSKGVAIVWPPTNEPWGVRECRIMHPDGHTFRISAPIE